MDYNALVSDPDFHALSPEAKQILLNQHDSDFQALSPEAQKIAVQGLKPPSTEPTATEANLSRKYLDGQVPDQNPYMNAAEGGMGVDALSTLGPFAVKNAPMIGSMLPGPWAIPGAIGGQIVHNLYNPPEIPGTFNATSPVQWPEMAKDLQTNPNPGYPPVRPITTDSGEEGIANPTYDAWAKSLGGAGLMGGAAAATGGLLPLAGRYLSPSLAGEAGSELPKLISGNRDFMTSLLNFVPGSKWMIDRYKNQFNNWALGERNNFIKTYADALPSNTEAGEALGGELRNILKQPSEAYNSFEVAGRTGGAPEGDFLNLPLPSAQEFAQANLENAKGKSVKWLQQLADNGSATTEDINAMLGGSLYGVKGDMKADMKSAIMKDLGLYDQQAGTQLETIRQSADDLYKQTMQAWKNNPVFNQIVSTSEPGIKIPAARANLMRQDRPDLVIDKAFGNLNTGTTNDLLQIKAALPEEVWNMSLARGIENNLAKAMDGGKLDPEKWTKIWSEIGPSMQKIAPEVYPRMQAWTDTIGQGAKYLPDIVKGKGYGQAVGLGADFLLTAGIYKEMGGGKEGAASSAAANALPMILAHKFLGPAGPGLIRRYASSALSAGGPLAKFGVAAEMNGMGQQDQEQNQWVFPQNQ